MVQATCSLLLVTSFWLQAAPPIEAFDFLSNYYNRKN